MNRKAIRLHFVGIGGIGMSGIAEVFFNQGYGVSGSDQSESETTRRLRELGIEVSVGHAGANVGQANVVVISSAVKPTNPEVLEARKRHIPVIPRAEMLGELMRGKTGIAIAGTHGKTTTTSMIASVFTEARLDPTIVIGGKVNALGGNAKLGKGDYVIAEADESDGSFLHLPATYAIVTNIDNDHLDHYGNLDAIDSAFVDFVGKIPFYGVVAVCAEDAGVSRCLTRFSKPIVTYGFSKEWDYAAVDVTESSAGSSFKVFKNGNLLGDIQIQVPGRHNVLNALSVIAVSDRVGLPFDRIKSGLANFEGVKRRFEVCWKSASGEQVIVDDYAHHPTEILATLSAAKAYWKGRIIGVFQPHRYSRTLHSKEGFLAAFGAVDVLFLTDIYAAGEEAIAGVDSATLAGEIRSRLPGKQVDYVGSLEQAEKKILSIFRDGDLVLCMGAGSITQLPAKLVSRLS